MIAMIRGTVADVTESTVTVDVGGVGYLVHTVVPGTDFALGIESEFFTHLAVRENALDLYGFQSRDEREMFLALVGVPKIGPRSAQQIMLQATVDMLKKAVSSDDAAYLSKMSGIGKKTAEKIVVELKGRLDDLAPVTEDNRGHAHGDTIDALIALGYSERDARNTVQKLPPEVTGTNEAVREALKLLSKP